VVAGTGERSICQVDRELDIGESKHVALSSRCHLPLTKSKCSGERRKSAPSSQRARGFSRKALDKEKEKHLTFNRNLPKGGGKQEIESAYKVTYWKTSAKVSPVRKKTGKAIHVVRAVPNDARVTCRKKRGGEAQETGADARGKLPSSNKII